MRLPIQYAFSYPDRWDGGAAVARRDADAAARVRAARSRPVSVSAAGLRGAASTAARGRSSSTPRTKSPSRRFSPAGLRFPGIPRVIERALDAADRHGRRAAIARRRPRGRRLGPGVRRRNHPYATIVVEQSGGQRTCPMTTLLAFLFVLGVLVFVHELGHFLVARCYGVRVLTFSLGFGPKLAQVPARRHGVLHQRRAARRLRQAGRRDRRGRRARGAPDEFLSKSKWVRFQVYLAGPIMNMLLAVIVLGRACSARGADVPLYERQPAVIGSRRAEQPGRGGRHAARRSHRQRRRQATPTWDAVGLAVVAEGQSRARARRRPQRPADRAPGHAGAIRQVRARRPRRRARCCGRRFVEVTSGRPAEAAGVEARRRRLIAVNGERGLTQPEMSSRLQRQRRQTPVAFTIERDGETSDVTVTPDLKTGSPLIGVRIIPYEVQPRRSRCDHRRSR